MSGPYCWERKLVHSKGQNGSNEWSKMQGDDTRRDQPDVVPLPRVREALPCCHLGHNSRGHDSRGRCRSFPSVHIFHIIKICHKLATRSILCLVLICSRMLLSLFVCLFVLWGADAFGWVSEDMPQLLGALPEWLLRAMSVQSDSTGEPSEL